jgi:hypothetical protein
MNKAGLVGFIIGGVLGASGTYISVTKHVPVGGEAMIDELSQKLFVAREKQALLERQIAALQAKSAIGALAFSNDGKETVQGQSLLKRSEALSEDALSKQSLMLAANEALQSGQFDVAESLFNKLLVASEDEIFREQVIDGLLSVFKSRVEYFTGKPKQTNSQLWTLFEMHKLKPSEAVRNRVMELSEQAYIEAKHFSNIGDVLSSADNLSSLMHLSKMLSYKLATPSGGSIDSADFERELRAIQVRENYLPELKARASMRLYSGTDIERAFVFWDYTNLAALDKNLSLQAGEFREEFIQATLLHLNHLKAMNQTGEIRSRLDYLRWSFSDVMSDPRLVGFY